jgi:hypothetical protein
VGVSPGGCYPDRGQVVRGCTEMCAATGCDRCWQHKYRTVGPEYVCMWGWVNMYRDMGGGGQSRSMCRCEFVPCHKFSTSRFKIICIHLSSLTPVSDPIRRVLALAPGERLRPVARPG